MSAETLERNPIGFRSGMYTGCGAIADAALALALPAKDAAYGPRIRELDKKQLLALPEQDCDLLCVSGELWVTRDGDIEDHILGPGQSFRVRRADQAAVQALKPSRVRVFAA